MLKSKYIPKTKIICTIGPASSSETVLRNMVLSGMDVVRLNCSHGSHDSLKKYIDTVRQINKKYRRAVKILLDLEGFRVRIGSLKNHQPVQLRKNQKVSLAQDHIIGDHHILPFDYKGPLSDIKSGHIIYIDDGNLALQVKRRVVNRLIAKVIIGGILKERKGINIPEAKLHFSSLTEKDKRDICFGIENRVDYIAQSFVRTKEDTMEVRKFLKDSLPKCRLIAKIENRAGIRNIEEILKASDGIMIARGDMGVSIPIWEVPMVQKMIIKKCNKKRKFVITATQMLESMVENLRPTRAEVTDVANAILDGTDYVMLSAESAIGVHPAETVKMMNNIIRYTEKPG